VQLAHPAICLLLLTVLLLCADANPGFQGSCGRCYEIACNPTSFKDNYGEYIDRGSVCYDSSASVVVMITDSCPCNYPSNYHSNYRWCAACSALCTS
jgi:hypothetical protein